ncbi:MAG: SAM-dependent methyltransferase [Clostridia bacterium]|nr:SAM-dependent methyltransferase [Clostridia bacterium]
MKEFSSFRDPSGAVLVQDGVVVRQINCCYQKQYEALMEKLYGPLTAKGLLVCHKELPAKPEEENGFLMIQPEQIPYISYPYEWSFGQLKDAALTTLRIHRAALDQNMILKDASAYNIQFLKGRPVLIDTLSFDFYQEGAPWIAYGQFCRHFMAPLMLMAYRDIRLNQLLRIYIDGIPIDLADRLLGRKGGFAALQHIHWHAQSSMKHAQDGKQPGAVRTVRISKFSHMAMIDSMIRIVEKLQLKGVETEWGDYYAHTNYTEDAAQSKEQLVASFINEVRPATTWDFGANDGRYTRLALAHGGSAVAFDIDPIAVERNYHAVNSAGENLLPLLLDLTNPSPAIGFANRERRDIAGRQTPDLILMLAVIHHLAISNNLPMEKIGEWVASLAKHLIIEFVPKEDSQVKTLLATRDDIFPDYTEQGFEAAFSRHFEILQKSRVSETCRTLYLMRAKA